MIMPLCNDVLTRISSPRVFTGMQVPKTYLVGEKSEHHGMPYTVKSFGCSHSYRLSSREPLDHSLSVWMAIKYKGSKRWKWDILFIGFTDNFQEKLVFGGLHPNPVFQAFWPDKWEQPDYTNIKREEYR